MGSYNPYAPQILGNEWVGIRDENTQFSPAVNVVESGTTFTTTTPYVIQDGRFYINEMPPNTDAAVYVTSVYPTGTEGLSGPVQRLLIPTETAFVTGATVTGISAVEDMLTPYDGGSVILDASSVPESSLTLGFNTSAYTILNGKRILGVSLLFAGTRSQGLIDRGQGPFIYFTDSLAPFSGIIVSQGSMIPSGVAPTEPLRVELGEVNRLWAASTPGAEVLPWNYADLLRFDPSTGGTKLYMRIVTGSNYGTAGSGISRIWYAALEVLYCEEQRLMLAGLARGINSAGQPQYGANVGRMRLTTTRALNPTLPAGDWTVTVSAADQGTIEGNQVGYPDLNALRELYTIPSLEGVQVNLTQTPGEEFEAIQTHVLTQLSLHASGGVLTEVHSYGRQYPGQVYGSVTAAQQILDNPVGGSASFPQVRYYARHFTGTTQPLVLTGLSTLSASTTSITVAEFDALPEILDGWKEVTLRFTTPPTMGAISPDPRWEWSSVGETAATRWEILAMQAPAVSGIPGDYLNLVSPASQRLGTTTYEPPVGDVVELSTLSMYASGGAANQADVDATLIFSQDPPTVTGMALTLLTQSVTGIGQDCFGNPCCIPTSISYVRLTWPSQASALGTAFGAIELQRYDPVDGLYRTIMSASSAAVTGFNDFEARVGVLTSYRIRLLNVYRFAGSWSAAVSGTVATPGVAMACSANTGAVGVLTFTSNSNQSGSQNLAYAMQFDRAVDEAFAFPEAATLQIRRQYARDYAVAYRPIERGGEVFSRTVLVQSAAGALPNMANMRSLRDLAWADLPYVCVRDELGNRWMANVNVPDGTISQRQAYLARIDVVEVTNTPIEVDPS